MKPIFYEHNSDQNILMLIKGFAAIFLVVCGYLGLPGSV